MPDHNHTSQTTSPPLSSTLPEEVITCLQNARFLHLATSSANVPHISLMNYTYLPSSPYISTPSIIMTTPPTSRKTLNLASNPLVSLLVHDWVSHRPPTLSQPGRSPSPARQGPISGSLAELLLGMNTASLSRISTTINGIAEIVTDEEEESWYKAQHLANNTFGSSDASEAFSSSPGTTGGGLWAGIRGDRDEAGNAGGGHGDEEEGAAEGDGGRKCYVEGEEVRVVVVRIRDGRIADWKGQVRDWTVRGVGEHASGLTNGV